MKKLIIALSAITLTACSTFGMNDRLKNVKFNEEFYDLTVSQYDNSENVNDKLFAVAQIKKADFALYGKHNKKLNEVHDCLYRQTAKNTGASYNQVFNSCI